MCAKQETESRRQMEKWTEIRKSGDFAKTAKKYGIDPVIARIIRNRDMIEDGDIALYLNGGRANLHDPHLLRDADKGADIITEKIRDDKRIRIIGDYDVDGVNAAYILLAGLKYLGADADAAIPNRMKDGYGINENLIALAKKDGIDTIVTCDNGIAALEAIDYAKQQGMTVVVTDHHDIPYHTEGAGKIYLKSSADAVINPKQESCAYPYKELCGAAVAWKFLQVLYEKMQIPVEEADIFIENVGFATVGDVMDLTGENRILVKLGLRALRHTQNPGMHALILQNNLGNRDLSAYHIGFILGPCMNASGRLDTAQRSLALLMEQDEKKAAALATELISLNISRKEMTVQETARAKKMIEENTQMQDKVLVVYLPDCHESLAGIIAGRIREEYHRPVFVLTKSADGVKGSGRSIEEYSMYDELTKVSDLLTRYGGHPMAAGFSMEESSIEEFARRLNEEAGLTEDDMTEKVRIDVVMPISYATPDFIGQLSLLEPCGKGNAKPVFADRGICIERAWRVGKNNNVLKMNLRASNGSRVSGVYFGDIDGFLEYFKEQFGEAEVMAALEGRENHIRFAAVYEPAMDDYNGRNQVQIVIRRYR